MNQSDFFFAYNKKVAKWLKYEKGISFLFKATHPNTRKLFYLFERTPELHKALKEYQKLGK